VKVEGEQDFMEETDGIRGRKEVRKSESGEDFWRHNQ